jgi:hypothetical protein
MQSIAHLTLLTGDLRHSSRKEVRHETIEMLMPYVMSAGGAVGNTGWTVRMVQGAGPGSCGFTLHHSGLWLFSCYMAWTTTADAAMWNIVRQVSKTRLPKPTSVPWLAVHVMPSMMLASPHTLMEAGDLERCIAWTVIAAMAEDTTLAV